MQAQEFINTLESALTEFEEKQKLLTQNFLQELDAYKKSAMKEIEKKVHTQEEQKMANLEKELADLA